MNKDEMIDKDENSQAEIDSKAAENEVNENKNADNAKLSSETEEEDKDPIHTLQLEVADWKNKYLRLHF